MGRSLAQSDQLTLSTGLISGHARIVPIHISGDTRMVPVGTSVLLDIWCHKEWVIFIVNVNTNGILGAQVSMFTMTKQDQSYHV